MHAPSPTLTIDLEAVAENTRRLKTCLTGGAKLLAVVKANAFGMGALDVSRAALAGGADMLAVGRGEEVRILRAFGIEAPVLVQGPVSDELLPELAGTDTAFTIWDRAQLPDFVRAARAARHRIRLHLEVDTGMHRLGATPEDALDLAMEIVREPGLVLAGTMTNFACADELDPAPTLAQWRMFSRLLECFEAEGLHPGLVHAADDAAVLRFPQTHAGGVRAGLLLFGILPNALADIDLLPTVRLQATVLRVATVPVAEGIGYGMRDAATTVRRIATVGMGYADGLRGAGLAPITGLVHGRRVRQVGSLSMDLATFDVTHVPSVTTGDAMTLIGQDGEESITVEDMARDTELSPWKLLTSFSPRIRRNYLGVAAPAAAVGR